MQPDFHLLIIGGGMVGAGVAALAAAHRELGALRIAVLEPQPPAHPPSLEDAEVELRVSALSRASERILTAAGAWSSIPARCLSPYEEMVVWDAAGRPRGAGSIHFSASTSGEPNLGYIVENRRVLWALHDCRALRGRVTLLRTELEDLALGSGHAVVSLADGRKLSAALVIGADGAASRSRSLAGIESLGWEYGQRAFVTHVRTEHSHARTAWQRFLPEGPIAFLPLADGRSSIVWTTRPAHAAELIEAPAEQVARAIETAIDGALGGVELAAGRAQFPLRLAHARNYCRERFVLIGDAAHAVHPLAGQGVNLGFLDGAALIEVLAGALAAGVRAEALGELKVLRRYERWRKSENTFALGLVDGLNRLFGAADPLSGWLRRTGLGLIDRSPLAKRFLMGRALGTHGEVPGVAAREGAGR